MISPSGCYKSGCKVLSNNVGDLKYHIRQLEAKLSLFDEVTEEKEELKKQLADLSKWMDDVIRKQKDMFGQLTKGHEEVWCMYQSTKRDLDRSKSEIASANAELLELNERTARANDRAKQLEKQKECSQEKIQLLEKRLCEELSNLDAFKCKYQSQEACLQQKTGELDRAKQTVDEQAERLTKLKSDLRMVRGKLDLERENCAQIKNEAAINEKRTLKEKETLESQIEIMDKDKVEMENVLAEQNATVQELNRKTLDMKQRNDEIKCMLEKERCQSDERIAKLTNDKQCLEAAAEELNCKMSVCAKESARLKCENEKLSKLVKELQNKLEAAARCHDEQTRAADEEHRCVSEAKNRLQCCLDSANRKVDQLEEDLANVRKSYAAEKETVCELRKTIADLQFNQQLVPNPAGACSGKNIDLQLADFGKVLDNITGDCCKKPDGSRGKPKNLEQLVKELSTISDSLARSSPC
ncbi:tropomyosin alpha-1 chain-like isoform X2 [Adelges cooleyi]|nr:tropomyosin alpha-1 chain-like isoform X2 [Adelges cooleyi]XP_050426734.1 tropomyosin alpha-1 chain-like isoform X2 [Adelges cooleyi]